MSIENEAAGGSSSAAYKMRNPNNPVVFFDVGLAGREIGRVRMELFADCCPKTAENFRQFCTGEMREEGKPLGYKNCTFHRVIRGFMVQGGDFVKGDGTGCKSIYGHSFPDENFELNHDRAGLLSMANSGPDTNGCQFFITCGPCAWLNGKHVVFGTLMDDESMLTVRRIENVTVDATTSAPKLPVEILECGEM